jgi:site-specific DNA recombinase
MTLNTVSTFRRELQVCEAEAEWVRRVFSWFVAGKSIGWIARELTRLQVPKGHRASTPGWHPQQVRRMLANAKYVGRWAWGSTTTVRDSAGRKKQVAVAAGEAVVRDRPDLRVVEQDVWDRAAARLAKLNDTFGLKGGHKPRGPKPNPADVYPRSPLGGLLACAACGGRMHQAQSNARRYYACAGAKKGLCRMTTQVPADRAEKQLTGFVLDLLRGWPEWVGAVYRRTCALVREAAARVPDERERDRKRSAELGRQIDRLLDLSAAGGGDSPALAKRLREAEREKADVDARLAASVGLDTAAVDLPDERWVADRLAVWVGSVDARNESAPLLRHAVVGLTAEAVVAPGKTRGYARLRFRLNAWAALTAAIGDALPAAVRPFLSAPLDCGDAPEFVIDLGRPTAMDEWAPRIAEWRAEGVTWTEIASRTGMDLNRAFVAWKRYTGAVDAPADG